MNNFRGAGFGGNMQALMKQAQKMQQDMLEAQQKLAEEEITVNAGGGMVTVTITGNKNIKSLKLDKSAVDPDDIELLEDLIVAAFNDAYKKVEELEEKIMGPFKSIAGGLI